MDNAKYHSRDIKNICSGKLRIEFKPGKESNGWYWLDGKKATRITIPKGRKPVPRGTYQSMAKQLKLQVPEFDQLLGCGLSSNQYEILLRERVI